MFLNGAAADRQNRGNLAAQLLRRQTQQVRFGPTAVAPSIFRAEIRAVNPAPALRVGVNNNLGNIAATPGIVCPGWNVSDEIFQLNDARLGS